MNERPIALRAIGAIGCSYQDICRTGTICGRLNYNVPIGQIPVDPKAEDLSQVFADLRSLAREWSDRDEIECTRPDNFKKGEPVTVFRASGYFVERVYKNSI